MRRESSARRKCSCSPPSPAAPASPKRSPSKPCDHSRRLQPDFRLAPEALLVGDIELVAQVAQLLRVGGGVDAVGPHHDGIFAVVGVVAAAEGGLVEAVFAVEVLGGAVAFTYFQSGTGRSL